MMDLVSTLLYPDEKVHFSSQIKKHLNKTFMPANKNALIRFKCRKDFLMQPICMKKRGYNGRSIKLIYALCVGRATAIL